MRRTTFHRSGFAPKSSRWCASSCLTMQQEILPSHQPGSGSDVLTKPTVFSTDYAVHVVVQTNQFGQRTQLQVLAGRALIEAQHGSHACSNARYSICACRSQGSLGPVIFFGAA